MQLECRLHELLQPRGSQAVFVVGEVVLLHLEGSAFQAMGHAGLGAGTHTFTTVGERIRIAL